MKAIKECEGYMEFFSYERNHVLTLMFTYNPF